MAKTKIQNSKSQVAVKSSSKAVPVKKKKGPVSHFWTLNSLLLLFVFSAVIFSTAYFTYERAMYYSLVFCDDNIFVLDYNEFNKSDDAVSKAFKRTIGTSYYRPVLDLSFINDCRMSKKLDSTIYTSKGMNLDTKIKGGHRDDPTTWPFIYKRTNIWLHVIGSVLVFIFFVFIGYRQVQSFIFGMLFTLHPILSPAASWISGRNDSLMTIFVLLSFIFMISYLRNDKWFSWILLLVHFLMFTIAMFTKEIGAMFVPVAATYIYIFWVRTEKLKLFSLKNVLLVVGWGLIGIVWNYMRQQAIKGIKNPDTIGFEALMKNYPTFAVFVSKIFLPLKMIALSTFEWPTILAGVGLIILIVLFFIYAPKYGIKFDRWRGFVGASWFLWFLVPTLMVRIVYVDDFFDYAEHRAYLPMIGMIWMIFEIINSFKIDFKKPLTIAISSILIIIFFYNSYNYVDKFEDRKHFWGHMVATYPYKSRGYLDLGKAYYVENEFKEAEECYFKGIERNPNNFNLYIDLSAVYLRLGEYAKSIEKAEYALKLDPTNMIAKYNLGKAYLSTGKNKEGADYLSVAASMGWQKFPGIFFDIGQGYFRSKEYPKSIEAYNNHLKIMPNHVPTLTQIGFVYANMNNFDKALEYFKMVMDIEPTNQDAWNNTARVYNITKKFNLIGPLIQQMKARGVTIHPDVAKMQR
ncbi:MAG: tetratricopeptide repeat protein [Candidatus Kapabacteria bacterium]|nr:tetratricopeptide repeat protein [Candidatus Kapabacteria bacterium]